MTPRTDPALIDVISRYPLAMSTITRLSPPSEYQCAAPPDRLVMPDTTAASRSALARSRVADIAINSPSDDTATASSTPAVPDVNESSSQLKVCASGLSWVACRCRSALSWMYGVVMVILLLLVGPHVAQGAEDPGFELFDEVPRLVRAGWRLLGEGRAEGHGGVRVGEGGTRYPPGQ